MDLIDKCHYCKLPKKLDFIYGNLVCQECKLSSYHFECQVCCHQWMVDENKKWGTLPYVISGINFCSQCMQLMMDTINTNHQYYFSSYNLVDQLKNIREEKRRSQLQITIERAEYNSHISGLIYSYTI